MPRFLVLAAALAVGGCTVEAAPAAAPSYRIEEPLPVDVPEPATVVLDRAAYDRLLAAKGVTLQWISWDYRGSVSAWRDHGVIYLRASQDAADGKGRLELDGHVVEVGAGYFVFDGRITIRDTPDPGRSCEADKLWHFAITQNRPYWRLREFEWCDGLTDYVDIYF